MAEKGGFTPKVRRQLADTASKYAGNGGDQGLEAEVRFLRRAIRLLHSRDLHPDSVDDTGELAVFLLAPGKPNLPIDAPRVPIVSAKLPFNGNIWWTNEAITYGFSVSLTGPDDQVFDTVEEWGYGKTPAVVFDPASNGEEIRYYPEGLSEEPLEARALSATEATLDAIERGMEALRVNVFTRPGLAERSASPWKDASHNFARTDAESIMQGHVQTALSFHFHNCEVRTEANTHHGRLDVLLEEYVEALGAWKVHCILELKILRSFNENGNAVPSATNRSAITKGVLQALKYRTDRNATWSALYCFDLRVDDVGDNATFAHVAERAAQWDVALRRWFISSSAEAARTASAPAMA